MNIIDNYSLKPSYKADRYSDLLFLGQEIKEMLNQYQAPSYLNLLSESRQSTISSLDKKFSQIEATSLKSIVKEKKQEEELPHPFYLSAEEDICVSHFPINIHHFLDQIKAIDQNAIEKLTRKETRFLKNLSAFGQKLFECFEKRIVSEKSALTLSKLWNKIDRKSAKLSEGALSSYYAMLFTHDYKTSENLINRLRQILCDAFTEDSFKKLTLIADSTAISSSSSLASEPVADLPAEEPEPSYVPAIDRFVQFVLEKAETFQKGEITTYLEKITFFEGELKTIKYFFEDSSHPEMNAINAIEKHFKDFRTAKKKLTRYLNLLQDNDPKLNDPELEARLKEALENTTKNKELLQKKWVEDHPRPCNDKLGRQLPPLKQQKTTTFNEKDAIRYIEKIKCDVEDEETSS